MNKEKFATIQEVYDAYDIMPQLREHMIRVAAVGTSLAHAYGLAVEQVQDIQLALLLHDMGNIIKFNLDAEHAQPFMQEKGSTYWKNVQRRFVKTYGADEDVAHDSIAQELGVSHNVARLIKAIGFRHMCHHVQNQRLDEKICAYADLRVAPHGIVSLDERLKDGRKRYAITKGSERWDLLECAHELEEQLFADIDIAPEDITATNREGLCGELAVVKIGCQEGNLTII